LAADRLNQFSRAKIGQGDDERSRGRICEAMADARRGEVVDMGPDRSARKANDNQFIKAWDPSHPATPNYNILNDPTHGHKLNHPLPPLVFGNAIDKGSRRKQECVNDLL
jgi:hypothetical protein